jgi:predicted nucleic acid-binding protein
LKVVFNASPLIILNKLNLLEDVFSLFQKKYIPSGVIDEINQKTSPKEEPIESFLKRSDVFVKDVQINRLYLKLRESLAAGETEAILLAIKINSNYVILDDKVARNKAASFGLKAKGTIGILRILYQKGLLEIPPDKIFIKLKSFNFRIKEDIYREILREFYQV